MAVFDITNTLMSSQEVGEYTSAEHGVSVFLSSVTAYHWTLSGSSTQYLVNSNMGVANSASMSKVWIYTPSAMTLDVDYIQSSEKNYDYAAFFNLDYANVSAAASDTTNIFHSAKGQTSGSFSYSIPSGTHFFYMRYAKDGSTDSGLDKVFINMKARFPVQVYYIMATQVAPYGYCDNLFTGATYPLTPLTGATFDQITNGFMFKYQLCPAWAAVVGNNSSLGASGYTTTYNPKHRIVTFYMSGQTNDSVLDANFVKVTRTNSNQIDYSKQQVPMTFTMKGHQPGTAQQINFVQNAGRISVRTGSTATNIRINPNLLGGSGVHYYSFLQQNRYDIEVLDEDAGMEIGEVNIILSDGTNTATARTGNAGRIIMFSSAFTSLNPSMPVCSRVGFTPQYYDTGYNDYVQLNTSTTYVIKKNKMLASRNSLGYVTKQIDVGLENAGRIYNSTDIENLPPFEPAYSTYPNGCVRAGDVLRDESTPAAEYYRNDYDFSYGYYQRPLNYYLLPPSRLFNGRHLDNDIYEMRFDTMINRCDFGGVLGEFAVSANNKTVTITLPYSYIHNILISASTSAEMSTFINNFNNTGAAGRPSFSNMGMEFAVYSSFTPTNYTTDGIDSVDSIVAYLPSDGYIKGNFTGYIANVVRNNYSGETVVDVTKYLRSIGYYEDESSNPILFYNGGYDAGGSSGADILTFTALKDRFYYLLGYFYAMPYNFGNVRLTFSWNIIGKNYSMSVV